MKEGIHPEYKQTTIKCACGEVIENRLDKREHHRRNLFKMPSVLYRKTEAC